MGRTRYFIALFYFKDFVKIYITKIFVILSFIYGGVIGNLIRIFPL